MSGKFRQVVNGAVNLCTEAFGNSADPAIILVMGSAASMMWWPDRFCNALVAAGRFVVRFDHRDTGQSSSGPAGSAAYSIDDFADDVINIMDAYALDAAHLVGMSLGGLVSQLVAVRDSGRVRSLTVIGAEPLGGEPVDAPGLSPEFIEYFATIDTVDWENKSEVRDFLTRIAELCAAPTRGLDHAATTLRIEREISRAANVRTAFNHAMIGYDRNRWDLRAITVPTLVIHGAHDPLVSCAKGEAIARQIPNAVLKILPDAGHELHSADLDMISGAIIAHTGQHQSDR
jgi:pimeloyl-ACP methyl ester carboxylesterase